MAANHRIWLHWSTAWVAGIALGVLVVGRPWGSGALLNLDLAVVNELDVPDSLWALGPEVPRRAPLLGLGALLSPPLSGVTVMKLWMVAVIAVAGVGMYRHLRVVSVPLRLGAAVAYAVSPFMLTRFGVGHLALASAAALVPWTAPTLLDPYSRWRRTVLAAMAHALCGYFGLVLLAPQLAVGMVASRRAPRPGQVAALIASQTPWLLPALITSGAAGSAAGSDVFPTDVDGLGEAVLVAGGYGFWQPTNQIGAVNPGTFAFVLVLVTLAAVGWRWSTSPLRNRVATLGLVGWAVALCSAIPGISSLLGRLTDVAVFAPWRESQRLAVLAVFAAISLAARGLDAATFRDAARSAVAGSVVAAAAVLLVASSMSGLDGRVDPIAVPSSWTAAARAIEAEPGTVLALPWNQYFDVRIADERRAHNPVPFLLGGDVLFSHDLQVPGGSRVSRDAREDAVPEILGALRVGEPISDRLDRLGIRWIVVLPDVELPDASLLRESPAVETRLDEPEIALFESKSWQGTVVTASGRLPQVRHYGPWIATIDSSEAATWYRMYEPGWLRGASARVDRGPDGITELPGGPTWLWNWIGVAVALAHLAWLVAASLLMGRMMAASGSKTPTLAGGELA